MSGKRIKIGARETYFPPFVNELFDGPPYWACTFAALLNGANVGYLGNRSPTHAEVRRLARASGDDDLSGGSRSSDMIRAMRVRYGKRMYMEALPPRRVHERLSSGWAMVGAVTYGALPGSFRRHSPHFKKGHRITLVGWDGKASRILDPMAKEDLGYTGERILWSQFEDAWWGGEQLWFAEGMFRKPPQVKVRERVSNGEWRIEDGRRLVARLGRNPRVIIRKVILSESKSGQFDAVVEAIAKDGKSMGEFIRVSSGGLAGMLIPVTRDLRLKPKRGASRSAPKKQTASTSVPTDTDDAFLEGRKAEYKRIKDELGPVVNLPPPPD